MTILDFNKSQIEMVLEPALMSWRVCARWIITVAVMTGCGAHLSAAEKTTTAGTSAEAEVVKDPRIDRVQKAIVQVRSSDGEFGTGFLVSTRGDVVTTSHTIAAGANVHVRMAGTRVWHAATLVLEDQALDLAVLRFLHSDAVQERSPLSIAQGRGLPVGARLFTLGFLPGEFEASRQRGEIVTNSGGNVRWDGAAVGGYSGAPLCLDGTNVVVGVALGEAAAYGHADLRPAQQLVQFLTQGHVPFDAGPEVGDLLFQMREVLVLRKDERSSSMIESPWFWAASGFAAVSAVVLAAVLGGGTRVEPASGGTVERTLTVGASR